jgi:hypothetical protein
MEVFDEKNNDSATKKLISIDSSTHLDIQVLYHCPVFGWYQVAI